MVALPGLLHFRNLPSKSEKNNRINCRSIKIQTSKSRRSRGSCSMPAARAGTTPAFPLSLCLLLFLLLLPLFRLLLPFLSTH